MSKLTLKGTAGFTLIELLIAVAVIGILSAIAYPSYRDQVIKTQRTDGKAALMQAASLQERWFTENSEYTNDMDNLGGTNSREGHFTISVAIGDITGTACNSGAHTKDNCFILTATLAATGDACGNLLLDNFGRKTVSGTDNNCW